MTLSEQQAKLNTTIHAITNELQRLYAEHDRDPKDVDVFFSTLNDRPIDGVCGLDGAYPARATAFRLGRLLVCRGGNITTNRSVFAQPRAAESAFMPRGSARRIQPEAHRWSHRQQSFTLIPTFLAVRRCSWVLASPSAL